LRKKLKRKERLGDIEAREAVVKEQEVEHDITMARIRLECIRESKDDIMKLVDKVFGHLGAAITNSTDNEEK